jgi:hypothetical protein
LSELPCLTTPIHRLEIVADSASTVLSRVCGILANLCLIPYQFQSTIGTDDGT